MKQLKTIKIKKSIKAIVDYNLVDECYNSCLAIIPPKQLNPFVTFMIDLYDAINESNEQTNNN